jgi:hypothetical protein
VESRPWLRSEAGALIDTLLRSATQHPGGHRMLSSLDDLTVGRLLVRQARLGRPVPAGMVTTSAVDALTRELRQLEGPDQFHRRFTLAGEALALARAVEDVPALIIAAHHQAMAAEIAGDFDAREQALAVLASADAEGGPRDERYADALLIDHAVAVAVTQGRFTDAMLTTKVAEAGGGGRLPGIAPTPGSMAVRQMLVTGWLRVGSWPAPHGGTPGGIERSLTALVHGERGLSHLTVRSLATGVEPLPPGDEWLHTAGLLAFGAVELGDPTTADAVRTLLNPYAGLVCGVGYRSFVGPVSFHLGRLSVIMGDWAEAERHLTSALSQLGSRQARPWIALTQQALAQALRGRARPGDRRWAEALQAEAGRMLTSLGVPPQSR